MMYYLIGIIMSVIIAVIIMLQNKKNDKPFPDEDYMPFFIGLGILVIIIAWPVIIGFAMVIVTIWILGKAVEKLYKVL